MTVMTSNTTGFIDWSMIYSECPSQKRAKRIEAHRINRYPGLMRLNQSVDRPNYRSQMQHLY